MLTRLYVDNYRCLVDFEFKPKQVQLLLGVNGTGKSSVFDVLDALRRLVVDGAPLEECIGHQSQTRWAIGAHQRFIVEFDQPGIHLRYTLVAHSGSFVKEERLEQDGDTTMHLADGRLIQTATSDQSQATTIEFRKDRSALSGVDSPSALLLRSALQGVLAIQINPWAMTSRSEHAASRPDRKMANLSDWFRHLAQQDPRRTGEILKKLAEVLPGLETIVAAEAGLDVRVVHARFRRPNGGHFDIRLSRLSEGQRLLIALYMLICNIEPGTVLLLDEPENFIAAAEIQPWLLDAKDSVEEAGAQLILASHHPEIVNQLAEGALLLVREDEGPTRLLPFPIEKSGLTPAELVARGWESA